MPARPARTTSPPRAVYRGARRGRAPVVELFLLLPYWGAGHRGADDLAAVDPHGRCGVGRAVRPGARAAAGAGRGGYRRVAAHPRSGRLTMALLFDPEDSPEVPPKGSHPLIWRLAGVSWLF